MKEVVTQNSWAFELETGEGINIVFWIIVVFQQKERQDSQNLNNDTFYRPPVTSAHCVIRTEIYPDFNILMNYNEDDCSQGYREIKEAFRALTKKGYT